MFMYVLYLWRTASKGAWARVRHVRGIWCDRRRTDGPDKGFAKKTHRPGRARSLRKFPNDRVPETTGFDEGSAVDGRVRFKVFFKTFKNKILKGLKSKKMYKYNKTLHGRRKI